MAATNIECVKIKRNEAGGYPELQAIDETNGALIDYREADQKILIILSAGAASKVTVHGGNGVQGTDEATFEFDMANGDTNTLVLESGMYMDVKENKGTVKITTDGTVSIGAIALP